MYSMFVLANIPEPKRYLASYTPQGYVPTSALEDKLNTSSGKTARKPMTDIAKRKSEHIDVVLEGLAAGRPGAAGFDAVRFAHVALPELHLDHVDVSTTFLGKLLAAPYVISSMTGGPNRAEGINAALAEAAGELQIALAVGSQRVALEHAGHAGFDKRLRQRAGDVPLLANFGAAQLKNWNGPDMAERALSMIDADAMIIHVNPLQEALQSGGDHDWSGLLVKIEQVARRISKPVVVKEVGNGISGRLARRLVDAGVSVIDIAGAGGTSWAAVEGARADNPHMRAVAAAFHDWGIPTAVALEDVRAACPTTPLIASGGIKNGVDAAKAIRLGADIVGQAAGVLAAAIEGPQAVSNHFRVLIDQLRIAAFCTGSRDLAALKSAQLLRP
jgi:isopentenyl-diphosphate Delta-isomerase